MTRTIFSWVKLFGPVALLLGILTFGVCGQVSAETSIQPNAVQPKVRTVDATNADCVKQGGAIQPVCRTGRMACVVTYSDAGKPCTDGSQCQSNRCVALSGTTAKPGSAAQGKCKINSDPCGCTTRITDGKLGATLCID